MYLRECPATNHIHSSTHSRSLEASCHHITEHQPPRHRAVGRQDQLILDNTNQHNTNLGGSWPGSSSPPDIRTRTSNSHNTQGGAVMSAPPSSSLVTKNHGH